MKTTCSVFLKLAAVFVILVVALLPAGSNVQAKERTPMELPAYARVERELVFHTEEWAAISFYRPPDCVPDDFNLLDFFDWNALECLPVTTTGFAVWAGEPYLTAPIQVNMRGLGAVPVWLFSWPELEAAMADGSLTITELEGMPSLLMGTASFYSEILHPYDPSGVVKNPMIEYVAHGQLEDGRSFNVHALVVTPYQNAKWIMNMDITIK